MKTFVLVSTLAFVFVMGAPVLAQEPPPGPPQTPNAQMRQQFEANRKQMEQIHSQERAAVLGALTPAHKQLLATIAGQLATSTTPDYRGAEQRLDAALSSSEKQAILNASQTARDKMHAEMQTMRQQMSQMAPPGAPGRPPMTEMHGGPDEMQHAPTAGGILLRVALSGGGMEMHVHGSMERQHP
jgi:hypothetical protein